MKKIKLMTLIGTALVGVTQPMWAGPHGAGGGFSGGGRFGGGHFNGYAGGFHAAPAFSSGGARFSGRSIGALARTPQQFYYYSGARTSELTQHAFVQQPPNRSTTPYAGGTATITRQQNRAASAARQGTQVGDSQMPAAAVRRAIANHNVSRQDANWHRDWDKHRLHFRHGLVFVFLDGFWWGLSPAYYPWDYYPYYAYDHYPYDSYDYPYGYYESYPGNYDDYGANAASDEYGNNSAVSAVQSALANLGYYHGAIDGVLGDATEAALAHYQQDRDLSVTGTVTAATLQSLGLTRTAS